MKCHTYHINGASGSRTAAVVIVVCCSDRPFFLLPSLSHWQLWFPQRWLFLTFFYTYCDSFTVLSSTSVWGHWLKVHCWPFTSSFLLLLSFLPLIVPVVLYFPLPVSYSSFSQQFLLAILPPALLLSVPPHPPAAPTPPPPPCTYRTVNPFLSGLFFCFFNFVLSHLTLLFLSNFVCFSLCFQSFRILR